MKRILNVLIWLLVSSTLLGQSGNLKYPSYDTVVSKFFGNYSTMNLTNNTQIRFEKRPVGWYVALVEYSAETKTIKDELFWDRKENGFKKIAFDSLSFMEDNQAQLEQYKNDDLKNLYTICPYYGYSGWDWDVIGEFKDIPNLPDTTLYALGRAYSSFASNLLNNNSGLADVKYQFNLPAGKNCMTAEQLEKYRFYRHLAIEKYKKLTEQNPGFKTIVGTIGTSTSNEYLTSFLDMRMFQNEEEARNELVDGLYNTFYLSAAKNYLNSCAPNAILFTNGDNDTYPLLYVQSKNRFRTDVSVVNLSLLLTDRYINSLRENMNDAKGLPISLTSEEISGKNRELILLDKSIDSSFEIKDLIDFVKKDDHVEALGGQEYFFMPTNKFRLSQGESSVQWETDKNYLLRNQLIILDLLATNKWERPVYFDVSLAKDAYFGLEDYLKLEGLAYRLTSVKKDSTDNLLGAVNSTLLYSNLMGVFDWSGLKNLSYDEKLFCTTYRYNFIRLANELIKENRADSAKAILNKCMEILPNNISPFDYLLVYIIEDYFKVKEFEVGKQIVKQLLFNVKNNIDNYADFSPETRLEYRDAVIKKINELGEQYGQKEIISE